MARPGEAIENPVMRSRVVFRETAASTDGQLLRMDFEIAPGGVIAEEHVHPVQHERFQVLEGRLEGKVAGEPVSVAAEDSVAIEPGTPHAWWNAGPDEARLLIEFRPALRTETFFETVFRLAREGKTGPGGVPGRLQLAVLLSEYRAEFRPTGIGTTMQWVVVTLLAPLARLLGYRGR